MTEIEKTALGHINLRGNADEPGFVNSVQDMLGQPLPIEANTISLSSRRIYWLGPDEWLIVCDIDDSVELTKRLDKALADQHAAVNDVSGGQTVLHLSGPDVPALLARGCTLDLHPASFGVGDCAQSGLAKANVLLGCIDAAPVYEIIVRRSFSEYLERWLRHNTHIPADSGFC